MTQRSLIVFDGECHLCKQFTGFLKRWDTQSRLTFRPLQDTNLYTEFPKLDPEECSKAIHLIGPDGKIYRGAEILEPLLKEFPLIKNVAWMVGLPGIKGASHVVYEFISKNRHKIPGGCRDCETEDE